MSDFSFITNFLTMAIEWIGVAYFYRPLERRSEGRLKYLGWLCLLLLIPVYMPIIPELASIKVFSLENLFNQIVRTFINWLALYGYLRCTKECKRSVCVYLSAVYVLIYMVSFSLRQACFSYLESELTHLQFELAMLGLIAIFQLGIVLVAGKLLELSSIKDVGANRLGVIFISMAVELYFKFSLVSPEADYARRPMDVVFYTLSATIGVFIMVILFERNIAYHEKRAEMQLEQVQMQYEMQNARRYLRANADIRRLYHDMKNHLLALESMIKSGGEPEQYITELRSRLESYDVNVNTGNAVADTLLAEKIERARLDNISFNVCADLSMFSFMNSVDMVTILANAIDNAVEALIQLPEGQERIVYIKTTRYANMAVLRISNQFSGKLDLRDGVLHTGKADPAMHGIGLSSIQKAVERYGGSAETQFENDGGWFRLMIMIPVPEDKNR